MKSKGNYIFLSGIILLAIIFGVINYLIPYMMDDLNHKHIFQFVPGYETPYGMIREKQILSFGDIIDSVHAYYFTHGGRILVMTITQFLVSFTEKWLYSILAIPLFVIYVYQMGMASCNRSSFERNHWIACIPLMVFFVFYSQVKAYYADVTCGIGIFLPVIFIVTFWNAWTEKIKVSKFVLFVLGGLAGLSLESVAIPFLFSIGILYCFKLKKYGIEKHLAFIAFLLGLIIVCIAPGNFIRLNQENSSLSINNMIQIAKTMRITLLFVITFMLCIVISYKKTITWVKRINNLSLLVGLIGGICFVFYLGYVSPRQGLGVDIIATLLCSSLIFELVQEKKTKTLCIVSYFVSLLMLCLICFYQYHASKQIDYVVNEIECSQKKEVEIVVPHSCVPSFMEENYIVTPQPSLAPEWPKRVWNFYYNKEILFK